jgi:hypothetical protein
MKQKRIVDSPRFRIGKKLHGACAMKWATAILYGFGVKTFASFSAER